MESPTPTIERRANRRTGRPLGFTLVEALIASVLVAVCVAAVCGALSAAYTNRAAASRQGEALRLARNLLEEVCRRPMGAVAVAPSGDGLDRAVVASGGLLGTVKGTLDGVVADLTGVGGTAAAGSDGATPGQPTASGDQVVGMLGGGLTPVTEIVAARAMPATVAEFDGYEDAIIADDAGSMTARQAIEAGRVFVRAAAVEAFARDAEGGAASPVVTVTVYVVTPDGQAVTLDRVIADATPMFH